MQRGLLEGPRVSIVNQWRMDRAPLARSRSLSLAGGNKLKHVVSNLHSHTTKTNHTEAGKRYLLSRSHSRFS